MPLITLDQLKTNIQAIQKMLGLKANKADMDTELRLKANTSDVENIESQKMDKDNPVGTGSFSMGRLEGSVVGDSSHAEGLNTTASGNSSHAEGYGTQASGNSSHAEGLNTTASGNSSHAEGSNTCAIGNNSHAEGYGVGADGWYSHAEGFNTCAIGNNSHAEGSNTWAIGDSSHAEGLNTTASGDNSHAEGYCTRASGDSQHVQGKNNIEDSTNTYAYIVGNGKSTVKLSNAHTLDWSGNAWFAGDVYTGSTSGTNKDDGSKKLATEEYVDTAVANVSGGTGSSITVDSELSDTSENPVQNKVITVALQEYITETELDTKGYQTEAQVLALIQANIPASGDEVSY